MRYVAASRNANLLSVIWFFTLGLGIGAANAVWSERERDRLRHLHAGHRVTDRAPQ